VLLKAALNGNRRAGSHPRLPLEAGQLAADAAACTDAGAGAIHLHPRDAGGRESLSAEVIDSAVRTVRRVAPVPIGVSTGAWIEPDPQRRAALIATWREPDMASVNLGEEGAEMVMTALVGAGIGIEAGIWSVADVERLVATGMADGLTRVLVEIVVPTGDPAVEALRIDAALDAAGITAPRLHHGEGSAAWPVLRQAIELRRDIRIGLEDTFLLPDGSPAASNAALVRSAYQLAGRTAAP
jgi:uncharacterized protein (DUF849 family)